MIKNTRILFIFSLLLLLLSCNSDDQSKKEISNTITELYQKDWSIYDSIPRNLISKDLMNKIESVRKITKKDEDRIAKSASPTDKPILLEGSFLSSLYEGWTKFSIQKISIKDGQAEAIIDFENNTGNPLEKWTDTVVLVNEKGWKIDNVLYSKKYSESKDLKEKVNTISLIQKK